jgi:hypothetical protein
VESQTVGKLARAAALAALLVPLGSIASEAASIDCTFTPSGGASLCDSMGGAEGFSFGDSAQYLWGGGADTPGGYQIDLFFDNVVDDFNIVIEDEQVAQDSPEMAALLAAAPGHICIPISDGMETCVIFHATAPGGQGWTGDYEIYISWFAATDGQYGDSPGNRVRMLHIEDGVLTDITIPGSYTTDGYGFCHDFCDESVGDPGVGGTDNSFSQFVVTNTAIPEPSTMLLLGGGLVTGVIRRRRRRNKATTIIRG